MAVYVMGSSAGKIDEALLRISAHELGSKFVADIEPLGALH
jgi:hypothetical protein